VQATGAGLAIGAAGLIRDLISTFAERGSFGAALAGPATGYGTVYYLEIMLLFAGLVVIGPLARHSLDTRLSHPAGAGMAQLPS
jgi:BCD family chlorophyll transporter-like MFS transporter